MNIFKINTTIVFLFFSSYYLVAQQLPNLIPFKDKDVYGYCDSNLNVVIKAQYQKVYPFVEDRALVVNDNLNGFIDSKGKEIVPCIHRFATSFSDGYAMVGSSRHEAKYIDRKGRLVSEEIFEVPPASINFDDTQSKVGPIKEGRYFYRTNKNIEGYMTVDGDTISGSEYKYPYYTECYSTSDNYDQKFQHFFESRAIVSGSKGQGYIDLNGQLIIDTLYDVAFNFKEGRAKVKLNGKYGFIDKQGNIKGDIKYDQACYFYDGMAQVIINEKCGYINLEGKEVIPLIYDYWQGEQYSSFENGLVRVRINEKFGILNRNGKAITEVKYDDISPFYKKRAVVTLNDKFGLIDEDGKEVIPPIYARLNRLDEFALVFDIAPNRREYGLINIHGEILIEKTKNRPAKADVVESGLYRILSTTRGYYYIDKYGTKYLK